MSYTRLNPNPPTTGSVAISANATYANLGTNYGYYVGNVHFVTASFTTKTSISSGDNAACLTISPAPGKTVECAYAVCASNGQLLNAWVIGSNVYVRPHSGGSAIASGSTVKVLLVY